MRLQLRGQQAQLVLGRLALGSLDLDFGGGEAAAMHKVHRHADAGNQRHHHDRQAAPPAAAPQAGLIEAGDPVGHLVAQAVAQHRANDQADHHQRPAGPSGPDLARHRLAPVDPGTQQHAEAAHADETAGRDAQGVDHGGRDALVEHQHQPGRNDGRDAQNQQRLAQQPVPHAGAAKEGASLGHRRHVRQIWHGVIVGL